jgi:hypothetical protein
MDQTDRDRTDQRPEVDRQSGNDSPAAATGNAGCRFPGHGPDIYCAECVTAGRQTVAADNTATVCAWCPEIHILKLGPKRQAADVLIIYQQGRKAKIILNGRDLVILEAICPSCRAREIAQ